MPSTTFDELLTQFRDLRLRLKEAEVILREIGDGKKDGNTVLTQLGVEHPCRLLVETMKDGAATLTVDGTVLYSNKRLAAMLQVPLESLVGKPLSSYLATADQAVFAARLLKLPHEDFRDEMSIITGKGDVVPVAISYSTLEFPRSRKINVVITDITQQKQHEELLAAEKLAFSVIDQAGEVIIVCDERGIIIRASRLARQLCSENPLLKPFNELIRLRSTETGEFISILPYAPSELKNIEVEFQRNDGASYFLLNVSSLKGGRDQIIGFVLTLTDITERKKYKERLIAMNSELERRVEQRSRELQETQLQYLHAEKLSAIGQLSASIAHEFNNPLQGIMTILKGLKLTAVMDEEDRALLDAAISESERMKKLIRNLQEFNRPSSDRKVTMDVHLSIDSLMLLCKSEFKRKKIVPVLNYAEKLPQIQAVPDQFKQVLLNLLTNAADACRETGGVVTISTWREDHRVAVEIKDNGIGMEPGNLDLIFQPFFTTKPAVRGTGLGLSVCHGIVQNHRGEIRVESKPGEGSTFTVFLPIDGEEHLKGKDKTRES